jgi:hypothetical protein
VTTEMKQGERARTSKKVELDNVQFVPNRHYITIGLELAKGGGVGTHFVHIVNAF